MAVFDFIRRLHSAVNATGEERRNALMGKGGSPHGACAWCLGVTPSGDAVLEAVDDGT